MIQTCPAIKMKTAFVLFAILAVIAMLFHSGACSLNLDGNLNAAANMSLAGAKDCEVRARTSGGWVCGALRLDSGSHAHAPRPYAAFLAVPYAKQPLGELRFKELQPVEPWGGELDATQPGYVCPQTDVLYGKLMTPKGYSEECIHANVYVPLDALPDPTTGRPGHTVKSGLPILVFVHGGDFAYGSGDPDLHGPDNLVREDVVVITFNYRLNVFGFLSLDTPDVPGNNGLRDVITLLGWVRENAAYFGGDPDDVTLAGQSAGAAVTHLVTLSPLAEGLFHKAIIMSGTALPLFFISSPAYAQQVSGMFLQLIGINSTDPDEVHRLLIETPLEVIMNANNIVQEMNGLGGFYPVIESSLPGVNTVIPADTKTMLEKGYGKDIPLLIGFTNYECEFFKKRYEEINIMARLQKNLTLILPQQVLFTTKSNASITEKVSLMTKRYFQGGPSFEKYIKSCTESFFQYPALKVALYRSKTGGAPAYMYEFSYDSPNGPIRKAQNFRYKGAGHIEDLAHVFHVNSVSVAENSKDREITETMSQYVVNFIKNGNPDVAWPAITSEEVPYRNIVSPTDQRDHCVQEQASIVNFYDSIMWS